MASEYEKKFAEMKKYIPFLESMIKRLENTSTPSTNPRQAQLDKIRSLRDLLLDKNKRMKMENLLKCEQVLINLYTKVEQKVSVPKEKHPESHEAGASKDHLDTARSKLKTLSLTKSKLSKDTDTLPEIARASEIEEVCTPGSKEPALFQRRPYKHSPSPRSRQVTSTSPQLLPNKKNYTRVLVSPESSPWRKSAKTLIKESTIYTRRSPRRSPKRLRSPKSERKKSLSENKNKKLKDFNITLNVPEESLNSLNTKDILSRIINCSDGDVDIKTLRELRSQILGELKTTGGNDDISDLILRSYKNINTKETNKDEIEEGELSDSESEAIENIYGSVVIVDKNKQVEVDKVSPKEESRKIQICLVINSTSEEKSKHENEEKVVDSSDFEIFSPSETEKKMLEERQKEISQQLKNSESGNVLKEICSSDNQSNNSNTVDDKNSCLMSSHKTDTNESQIDTNINDKDDIVDQSSKNNNSNTDDTGRDFTEQKVIDSTFIKDALCQNSENSPIMASDKPFGANFYKPLNDDETEEIKGKTEDSGNGSNRKLDILNKGCGNTPNQGVDTQNISDKDSKLDSTVVSAILRRRDDTVQIPLLNEPVVQENVVEKDVVSQIDILQALKNEILGENLNIQSSDIEPPSLHQPKVVKVTKNADPLLKKRISIEKYKEKSVSSSVSSFKDNRLFISKEENNKKQSLKLTDKECERFQLPVKASLVESVSSEDDEDKSEITSDEIYSNLAPKSPDNEVDFNIENTQPVIIPIEPVKPVVEPSKLDIDMRQIPILSPNLSNTHNTVPSSRVSDSSVKSNEKAATMDYRTWNSPSSSSNDKQQEPYSKAFQNVLPSTPSRTPNMTPNARTYEMTPSYSSFDLEDNNAGRKHVYASSFGFYESNDSKGQSNDKRSAWEYDAYNRNPRWSDNYEAKTSHDEDFRNRQKESCYNESYKCDKYNLSGATTARYKSERRVESPKMSASSGRSDISNANNFSRLDPTNTPASSFIRLECPATPSNSLGRLECPPTPVHYFGNAECPQTPSHSFGRPEPLLSAGNPYNRLECPSTPNAAFGRVDAPMTPTHSFGRSDCALNQSYPYNRSDGSVATKNLFGRPEYMQKDKSFSKDPRLNRSQWAQEINSKFNDRERGPRDRNFGYDRPYNPHRKSYNGTESYRYEREKSLGRNEVNRYSNIANEQNYRPSNYSRREIDDRGSSRDRENFYSKNRNNRSYVPNSRAKSTDRESGSNFQREQSFKDNITSVKPHSGRSFVIDTSVNASFQDFMSKKGLQVYDLSFDSRRKRASSVGRDLGSTSTNSRIIRQDISSVRSLSPSSKLDKVNTSFSEQYTNAKNDRFRRASSVGRDILGRDSERTFQEVKDDFQLFKNKIDLKKSSKSGKIDDQKSELKLPSKTIPERTIHSRKESFEIRREKSKSSLHYSPTKNRRDPRMRRNDNEYKNKMRIDNRYKNTHGIVYSSDNIAKGAVLGSGYGVKNYKIPKIKRVIEEPEQKNETAISENKESMSENLDKEIITEKDVTSSKLNSHITLTSKEYRNSDSDDNRIATESKNETRGKGNKNDISEKEKCMSSKEVSRSKRRLKGTVPARQNKNSESDDSTSTIETTEKRITRSRNKNALSKQADVKNEVVKLKRTKKPFIYNSDSELEFTNSEKQEKKHAITETSNKKVDVEEKMNKPHDTNADLETDIFDINTENITSDFVIASINAFIADSCDEIDTPKNEDQVDFSDEITFENMIDNIVNSDHLADRSFDDIDEVIFKDLKTTSESNNEIIKTNLSQESEISNSSDPVNKVSVFESEVKCNPDQFTIPVKNKQNVIEEQNDRPAINNHAEDKINKEMVTNITLQVKDDSNSDAIVSTTGVDKDNCEIMSSNTNSQLDASNNDICSTCDNPSVEISNTLKEQSLPDSTNELQSYETSDVSSSHLDMATKSPTAEPDHLKKESTKPIDSIGSILSLLQDKSKIKQLLSMLDEDSVENEKIKKKLERISQIVSDEDLKEEEPDKETTKKCSECIQEPILEGTNSEIIEPQLNCIDDTIKEDFNIKTKHNQLNCSSEYQETESNKETIQTQSEHSFKDTENELCNTGTFVTQSDQGVDDIQNVEDEESVRDDLAVSNVNDAIKSHEIQNESNLKEIDGKVDPEISASVNNSRDLENSVTSETFGSDKSTALTDVTNPTKSPVTKKVAVKRGKRKVGRKWRGKKRVKKQTTPKTETTQTKPKKPSRELLQLREDIKEIFSSDDVLNATGIRMCRLVKLVDEKQTTANKDEVPVMKQPTLRKLRETKEEEQPLEKPSRKKPGPKPKLKISENETKLDKVKLPALKSKPKSVGKHGNDDPYAFESDSVESSTVKDSGEESESDDDDSDSSVGSLGNSEPLVEIKKKMTRKRLSIAASSQNKNKKQKIDVKQAEVEVPSPIHEKVSYVVDKKCFTDKSYCFQSKVSIYSCRLCEYTGHNIVSHYKQQHPHSEIPLSRMDPLTTKRAIEQCARINSEIIKQLETSKYICRFCSKEFSRSKETFERFFWHIVSMHTGEYKLPCPECVDEPCSFKLDIPPPPAATKGQLIGYVCSKCNYTQLSLENLKTHVVLRHNDEHTDVFTVNLALMSNKMFSDLLKQLATKQNETNPNSNRVLRSTRSSLSSEASEKKEDSSFTEDDVKPSQSEQPTVQQNTTFSKIQSKIIFEGEENVESNEIQVKTEKDDIEEEVSNVENKLETPPVVDQNSRSTISAVNIQHGASAEDIITEPHFKICYKESGAKEYMCCINGNNHYKTSLLISMKKHVQLKHIEKWDGFCFLCKVIVMPQGTHLFRECLQHFLDKHMDEFPVFEDIPDTLNKDEVTDNPPVQAEIQTTMDSPKPTINVRPLSQLVSSSNEVEHCKSPLPIIERVVSLGDQNVSLPQFSPNYPLKINKEVPKPSVYLYEEWQADIMSKKHRVVLEAMMEKGKLIKIFKCAGRFCSFTSDSVEEALMHASTHQRIGGEKALCCAYCDFNSSNNGIDLVMHVFKTHGNCQYACALCFYRAAANQSVATHIIKAHGEASLTENILHTTNVSAIAEDSSNLLSREQAVAFYQCGHLENVGGHKTACSFRTYTASKFYEHLQEQHSPPFTCGICSIQFTTAPLLIQHTSAHDMGMYQCAWCVNGADSEVQIMSHSSAKHPSKQPQAYLRLITSKDGANRVLPLANMTQGKLKIPTEDVNPGPPEDPVREAERSLDLEKLIRHIDTIAMSQPSAPRVPTVESNDVPTINEDIKYSEILREAGKLPPSSTENINVQPIVPVVQKETLQPTPLVLKEEPKDESTPQASTSEVIYCLDSDDEQDSSRTTVDASPRRSSLESVQSLRLSVNSNADSIAEEESYAKISISELCRCPYCNVLFRGMAGFRKHALSCTVNYVNKTVLCPHANCTKMLHNVSEIMTHYDVDHRLHPEGSSRTFICGVCDTRFLAMVTVKKHLKGVHKVEKCAINVIKQGTVQVYTIRPHEETVKQTRMETQRKLSVDTNKMKRFGPQDVNQLPINPILDSFVYCSLCEFSTKVRLNMVRHLQLHTEQQPVPQTEPVNPVPHLETNEKHFDKMVNLASSSVVTRTPDKPTRQDSVNIAIPVEAATRYPKYVPERQRYVCGAKGCTYITVDEDTLKRHWEALHPSCTDYRCTHCPPFQYLDTTKPLTSARIIGHLKMHEATLYACSSCSYYHFRRQILEKHLEQHKSAHIITVREESSTSSGVNTPVVAPTMDLKPWQCGLCQFKCMLRPEIVEHCFKMHQSKMQFKCSYCPYRTSDIENILKHQNNSHASKEVDVFYYFYREGSLSDEDDGTPRWRAQRDKMGLEEPEIKTEVGVTNTPVQNLPSVIPTLPTPVDLNIVKKEITEVANDEIASVDDLCNVYGQFSEPNGIKYKCSLCKVVFEDTEEGMQSHLYEELNYRVWQCGVCSYKAFHKTGLNEHMVAEHRASYHDSQPLPRDINIETWVQEHLKYQTNLIRRNKENLIKQKVLVPRAESRPSTSNVEKPPQSEAMNKKYTAKEIEDAFGTFCTPSEMQYRCPKCNCTLKEEAAMREHLESELSKIRWCCSHCSSHFQTYHEAQFHCKSHVGQAARPKEAIRDPVMRREWVSHIISTQKVFLHKNTVTPSTSSEVNTTSELLEPAENSLLVVRYEESVQTPDATISRKRPAPEDSDDDERLVIHEPKAKRTPIKSCEYCEYSTKHHKDWRQHVLRHYGLRPYACGSCDFTGYRNTVVNHFEHTHPDQTLSLKTVHIPKTPPVDATLKNNRKRNVNKDIPKVICLICETSVPENEMMTHLHDGVLGEFARKGNVVVKCGICLALRLDVNSLQQHHNKDHAHIPINYAFFKLTNESRNAHFCSYCNKRFKYVVDLRAHVTAIHDNLISKSTTSPIPQTEESGLKRKAIGDTVVPPNKRVAKKSTTKLQMNAVARKSTTKLPDISLDSDCDNEEHYSYYGSKPPPAEDYANVTTTMPFRDNVMPFTVKKLREIIQVDPKVVLKDIRN